MRVIKIETRRSNIKKLAASWRCYWRWGLHFYAFINTDIKYSFKQAVTLREITNIGANVAVKSMNAYFFGSGLEGELPLDESYELPENYITAKEGEMLIKDGNIVEPSGAVIAPLHGVSTKGIHIDPSGLADISDTPGHFSARVTDAEKLFQTLVLYQNVYIDITYSDTAITKLVIQYK